jgi:hypothetical protein
MRPPPPPAPVPQTPRHQIAFEYFCSPTPLSSCETRATAFSADGGGQVNFLDRHSVACPDRSALTQWSLGRSGSNYRLSYTCCRN